MYVICSRQQLRGPSGIAEVFNSYFPPIFTAAIATNLPTLSELTTAIHDGSSRPHIESYLKRTAQTAVTEPSLAASCQVGTHIPLQAI